MQIRLLNTLDFQRLKKQASLWWWTKKKKREMRKIKNQIIPQLFTFMRRASAGEEQDGTSDFNVINLYHLKTRTQIVIGSSVFTLKLLYASLIKAEETLERFSTIQKLKRKRDEKKISVATNYQNGKLSRKEPEDVTIEYTGIHLYAGNVSIPD